MIRIFEKYKTEPIDFQDFDQDSRILGLSRMFLTIRPNLPKPIRILRFKDFQDALSH